MVHMLLHHCSIAMIHLNLVQLEGFSLDSKISDIKAGMYKHTFQTLHASTLLTESQSSTLTHTHYHILKPVFLHKNAD